MFRTTAQPVAFSAEYMDDERMRPAQSAFAVVAAIVIGTRYPVYTQVSIGYLVAFAMLPMWLPLVLRNRLPRWMLGAVLVALASGMTLSLASGVDHGLNRNLAIVNTIELLGVLATAGAMYWVIKAVGVPPALVSYGIGLLFSVRPDSGQYSVSPWRFGFALPITFIVLGVATWSGRRGVEMAGLGLICVASLAAGARSSFAIQLLALFMLVLWWTGVGSRRRASVPFILGTLALLGLAVYSLTQAFNVEGLMGEAAQERTVAQLDTAGNLLLGGRPELGATVALMQHHPLGFGLGIVPNWYDMQVARAGMVDLGYDPLNGYVDKYMFGGAFRLHSITGEMWAQYGLAGLLIVAVLVVTAVRGLTTGTRPGGGDAITLFVCFHMLWNSFFSPWYSSIPSTVMLLALVWFRLEHSKGPPRVA